MKFTVLYVIIYKVRTSRASITNYTEAIPRNDGSSCLLLTLGKEIKMVFGKHINKYYLKYLHWLVLGVVTLLFVDFFQLELPELYRMVIDGIKEGEVVVTPGEAAVPFDMSFVLDKICLPLLFIAVIMVAGRFLWRICFFGSAIKVETDIRREMFAVGKGLSQEFYQKNKVGNLMSLFTNDLDTINECFGDGALMFFDALLLGGIAIIKMGRMNWLLTLLSLIPMVIMLLASTLISKYMMTKWRLRQEAFSALSDFSQENFSGIAVIKAFVKEGKELMAFRKLNKDNEKTNVDFTRASVTLRILVTLFVESVICIILGYGGYLVYAGQFSGGQLIEFISYFTSVVWPVMAISNLVEMSSRGKASLKRIEVFLDTEPTVCDKDGAEDVTEIRGDIEFRNLTFTYPDAAAPALEGVSFKINAGENVGIIGKTGSGKTTLVDLILRTYNVPDGTLFIDGRDVNTITIKSLRDHLAYVPQDNFLFSDTISANIAFASDDKSRELVEKSAILSDVHDNIVDFHDGYDTVLGERGVTVSGGQKQRISIARALMKEAEILILDDSVSAVDTGTEEVIIRNLRENRQGRTTILIAHRVTTVERMDKIIFVEDGRILAVGTHKELLDRCREYRDTVELQRLEDEGGDL